MTRRVHPICADCWVLSGRAKKHVEERETLIRVEPSPKYDCCFCQGEKKAIVGLFVQEDPRKVKCKGTSLYHKGNEPANERWS